MYYDLSISFPYLSLITPLSFYSISFSAYSYPVSSMPILIIGSYPSIRHRTLLLISIHSHINTPYPLLSCILFHFYPSIHILLCHSILPHYSTPFSFIFSFSFSLPLHHLLIILPIHSFPHHPLSFYSHSVLHPIPFQRHCPFLFFLSLLQTLSLIRFSPSILFSSLFPYIILFSFYSFYCFSSPLSSIILFHIHSRSIYSVPSLLSYHSISLLLSSPSYHSYSFPYSISFNYFFFHIINHFLLLFPSHFNHSFFNKHNNQISI